MKKETISAALGGLALGFVLGLAAPKLFIATTPTCEHSSSPPPSVPAAPTPDQFNHAIKEYRSMLETDPKNAAAWFQLGGLYYGTSQVQEAVECYNKVLEIDPQNVEALVQLGNLYYDSDQYQQAVDHYQRALELDPDLSDVRVDLATMYRRLEKSDEAIAQLKQVIKEDPQHATARLNLGIMLRYDKQDYPGAIAAWEEFLRIVPNHSQAAKVKELIKETKKLL
jgi:tetratricopeptide (TPR) repeat protein